MRDDVVSRCVAQRVWTAPHEVRTGTREVYRICDEKAQQVPEERLEHGLSPLVCLQVVHCEHDGPAAPAREQYVPEQRQNGVQRDPEGRLHRPLWPVQMQHSWAA